LTEANLAEYYWHSFWFLIRKGDRVVVGSADFKGGPNEKDEVEIGYGRGKEFEHNGYMTEAVSAMCAWARAQEKIKSVIAETYLATHRHKTSLHAAALLKQNATKAFGGNYKKIMI